MPDRACVGLEKIPQPFVPAVSRVQVEPRTYKDCTLYNVLTSESVKYFQLTKISERRNGRN